LISLYSVVAKPDAAYVNSGGCCHPGSIRLDTKKLSKVLGVSNDVAPLRSAMKERAKVINETFKIEEAVENSQSTYSETSNVCQFSTEKCHTLQKHQ